MREDFLKAILEADRDSLPGLAARTTPGQWELVNGRRWELIQEGKHTDEFKRLQLFAGFFLNHHFPLPRKKLKEPESDD